MLNRLLLHIGIGVCLASAPVFADDDDDDRDERQRSSNCQGLPTESQLRTLLVNAAQVQKPVGGLFEGMRMWAAVVNRDGELCAVNTSTADPGQVWPGSQAIAKSKAYTGNAFSIDSLPLSTARLYTFTQPGHSLWSLGQSNLFNPRFLAPLDSGNSGRNQIVGGLIFFGGGLPLYRSGRVIGGLGVSGDTSCADHEIAKRMRTLATLDPPGGPSADDIVYSGANPPADLVFTHPKCVNTYRNGVFIGNENPSTGY